MSVGSQDSQRSHVIGELNTGFKQEAHDKELLEDLNFEEGLLDLSSVGQHSNRSNRIRARGPSEYTPVHVGGLSVYFNRQPGAMPRRREIRSMDPDARGTRALNVLRMSEDAGYKPFLLMLEHGVPLAAVWDRCLEAGLNPKHLLDDPEGPAVHQPLRSPVREEDAADALFAETAQETAAWRAHRTDWHQMQRSSLRMPDQPLLPCQAGLLQQQRLEREKQAAHEDAAGSRGQPGHRPFVPITDNINAVTALDRQVGKYRRNFPHVYSSRPLAYQATAHTGVAAPTGKDVWGGGRLHGVPYQEVEFWRDTNKGAVRGQVGTYGAHKGGGGFSLAIGNRVPITWRTEKEIVDAWNARIDTGGS